MNQNINHSSVDLYQTIDILGHLFRSSHFSFLVFGHFWHLGYENTKILRNLCLHFARQIGQDGKKRKENHATKVTKIPKTKRGIYGMNETIISCELFIVH